MPGRNVSSAPKNNKSFAAPFMHLNLRKRENVRQGLDYRIVNKIMGSLEGGCSFFIFFFSLFLLNLLG